MSDDEEYEFQYSDDENGGEDNPSGDDDPSFSAAENAYYAAKAQKSRSLATAVAEMQAVLALDPSGSSVKAGEVKVKAIKQLTKMHLRQGHYAEALRHYTWVCYPRPPSPPARKTRARPSNPHPLFSPPLPTHTAPPPCLYPPLRPPSPPPPSSPRALQRAP
jgi:hypothetical protein